jgi:hypothetical protein
MEYEARFVTADPDGIAGRQAKTVTKTVVVRTRAEPKPYIGGRIFHVYPSNYKGPRLEPSFGGTMCACKTFCGVETRPLPPGLESGPAIRFLVHARFYCYHPEYYGPDRLNNMTSPVEGTYYLTAGGTPKSLS